MIGHTLGSYSIQRELGRGGMGAVYIGTHALLGRQAAVKVLLPELSRNQDIVQRFFNEARAATAIRHPGIVEIYDFGFAADGCAYIVMEFLDGEALATRLARLGRLSPAAALGIARQVALALGAAHRAGIVHRDLKPDNVFLVPDAETSIGERVKLLDFGIAKLAGEAGPGAMARTSTGAIMGTPYYMSPEQCKGAGQVDARSDLYSLGCMLFEMVCGRVPFVGEGGGEIIAAHIHVPAPAARSLAGDVPPELEALILRLMAKRAEDRPQSADATAHEIADVAARMGTPMGTLQPVGLGTQMPMPTPAPIYGSGGSHPPVAPIPTTLGTAAGEAQPAPKKSRIGLFVGLGVLLAAGVAIAVVVASSAGSGTSAGSAPTTPDARPAIAVLTPDAGVAPTRILDAGAVPVAVVDAAVALVTPDAAPMPSDREKLLAAAIEAIAKNDWQRAAELARALLAIDPKDPGAIALADDYFATHAINKKKDCKDQRAVAAEAAKLWPGAKRAAAMQKQAKACKDTTKPPPAIDAGVPDEPPNEDGTPTVQQLVKNATDAYKRGQYAQALRLCELVLDDKPRNPNALAVCGMAACSLKNATKAKDFIDRLGKARKPAVLQVCMRQGIDLEAGGRY